MLKATGAAAGVTAISLPASAASASVSGFTGSGYSSGSTATMQVRAVVDGTDWESSKNVELAFARTSYIPGADQLTATINWGDGSSSTYTSLTNILKARKTYASNGTYTITVTGMNPGIGIKMGESWYSEYLTEVLSWSNIGSLESGFAYCSNLVSVPNVLPVGVLSLNSTFASCYAFNSPLNGWNTSYVTSMESTFQWAQSFNQNIGTWNLSSCTTLRNMFNGANVFNNGGSDSINNWNTSNVTSMWQTFVNAAEFNQPIGGWDTSEVTTMRGMFIGATNFNNGGNINIGTWDTTKVTSMDAMFQAASSFNQPIGSWGTGAVTSMRQMFEAAYSFNQPIGSWNTGSVTDMVFMFYRSATPAMAFDQDISGWNVSSVGSNNAGFVNTNPGGAAYYQASWLVTERPTGFPSFN